jgi:drug/metabolite transporter (DMT)-like permease
MAIAGIRSAFAAVVVYAAFPRMKFTWSVHQLAGAAAFATTMITFVLATKMTTAANAVLLQYTAPAWVALFSAWFLKEKPTRSDWIVILLVSGGMLLFFMDKLTSTGVAGNLWGIASGFSFAWVILLTRRQQDTSPFTSIFLGNVVTALVCLPFMFQKMPDVQGWVGLVLLGVVQMGAAYIFFGLAARYITALDAAIILLIEPIMNPVWTYLAIGEVPGPMAVLGGVVILASITFRAALPWLRLKPDTETR